MSSSHFSDVEVETAPEDNDLEISFTATSQIPDVPYLPAPSRSTLPSRKSVISAFPSCSLGDGSQSGTPGFQITPVAGLRSALSSMIPLNFQSAPLRKLGYRTSIVRAVNQYGLRIRVQIIDLTQISEASRKSG